MTRSSLTHSTLQIGLFCRHAVEVGRGLMPSKYVLARTLCPLLVDRAWTEEELFSLSQGAGGGRIAKRARQRLLLNGTELVLSGSQRPRQPALIFYR